MRKHAGFSLMEMMIVMLIVAVVAAASAPMINKKMLQDQANDSPWVWTGADNSIAYNLKGNATQTAVIGAIKAPKKADGTALSKLHVESDAAQISLKQKNDTTNSPFLVKAIRKSILLSNKETVQDDSITIGYDAETTGKSAIAIGSSSGYTTVKETKASTGAIAIGSGGNALGTGAIAIGSVYNQGQADANNQTIANKKHSISIGHGAQSNINNGEYSVAIGCSAKANDNKYSAAFGSFAEAIGESSIAIGGAGGSANATKAEKTGSIAIGKKAWANDEQSIAIGTDTKAEASSAIAIGHEAIAGESGTNGVAIGFSAKAGSYGVALGSSAKGEGNYATALGDSADASGTRAISIGDSTASNTDSIAIGKLSSSTAVDGYAFGYNAKVTGVGSVAIGRNTQVSEGNKIQLGSTTNKPTVYIPGDLIVDGVITFKDLCVSNTLLVKGNAQIKGNTFLATDTGKYVAMRVGVDSDDAPPASSPELRYIKRGSNGPNDGDIRYGKSVSVPTGITSDRRLKNVGEAFKGGLAEIKKLEVFNYTFKEDKDKTPRVGVMAQDLQKIFPKAVFKGEDGFLRIRMEDMFYALVNAVKELDAKIQALKDNEILVLQNKVSALEKQNKEFEKTIDKLEKRLEKLERGK